MEYTELIFDAPLRVHDPFVEDLIHRERVRQHSKIILIPSESICPKSVREALGSVYNNVYAEGLYPSLMEGESEEDLSDIPFQNVRYQRYADRRFYKGCEYVNLIEYLAGRRAASLYATEKNPAGNIFVNVQPLSGSSANNAVYDAFVEPGGTVMGLSLMHGGHLTHGSEFNRSGKVYNIVSYGVNRETERLDYDEIARLAREHAPKMIIAGYTSYPWAPDWERFRTICDEVGALLFADVSHPAGMIAAGVYPNPIDYADVTTCTTHKTLFGPRGAIIMTTKPEHARAVSQSVFPGEQGGPHVNKFAAMAVAFKLAATEHFKQVQRLIVENARCLGEVLVKNGLRLAYGGTDTHIVLIDLKSVKTANGHPLQGETVVRMLDLAGIVANKNTIPGDAVTAEASGVRLGTPWISQRGITREGIEELGSIIARVITSIRPFSYVGLTGTLPRGKIEAHVLQETGERTRSLVRDLSAGPDVRLEYDAEKDVYAISAAAASGMDAFSWSEDMGALLIRGARAQLFLDRVVTGTVIHLMPREITSTLLLKGDGTLMASVAVAALHEPSEQGRDRRNGGYPAKTEHVYTLFCRRDEISGVTSWLRGLSSGYVAFDPEDIYRKIDGPVVIETVNLHSLYTKDAMSSRKSEGAKETGPKGQKAPVHIPDLEPGISGSSVYQKRPEFFDLSKPYFVGKNSIVKFLNKQKGETFSFTPGKREPRKSCLYQQHLALGASMVTFAGWEMPVRYGSILEEHRAVRERAGLFDISHMGVLEVSGQSATRFLDTLCSNYIPWIACGESQYGYLLDTGGNIIDDIMVYRKSQERYLVVVNAANAELDIAWLCAVQKGSVCLDSHDLRIKAPGPVTIRNLKDVEAVGHEALVDIALQGPASTAILTETAFADDRLSIERLRKNSFIETKIAGVDAIVSRTGYTGERYGYELFVHPAQAEALWNSILERGSCWGVVPVGLGARDSLRIEAGLPLHGHELSGPYNITPLEAGFGPYVKLHKPFFIGRSALLAGMEESKRTLVRFMVSSRGVRIVRLHDHVLSRRTGQVIGNVTSCAVGTDGRQVGMALVDSKFGQEGIPLAIVPVQREKPELMMGRKFPLHIEAIILNRFPGKKCAASQSQEERR